MNPGLNHIPIMPSNVRFWGKRISRYPAAMFALSPNVQEVLATRQLAMPLLDPRDTGLTPTAFACNGCRRAKRASAKRRGSTCRKTGCDGHHIFIDFAIPIARCVNCFTYGMRAQT